MLEKTTTRKAKSASDSDRGAGRVARNRLRIAWMYYVEGLTQNEIADKLGIGRVTVVRNINEALKQREVKIWIEGEIAECFELEAQLKKAFGLREAIVVPEPIKPGECDQGDWRGGWHVYHRQPHRRHVDWRGLGRNSL